MDARADLVLSAAPEPVFAQEAPVIRRRPAPRAGWIFLFRLQFIFFTLCFAVVIAISSYGWLYQADQLIQQADTIQTELLDLQHDILSLADMQDDVFSQLDSNVVELAQLVSLNVNTTAQFVDIISEIIP